MIPKSLKHFQARRRDGVCVVLAEWSVVISCLYRDRFKASNQPFKNNCAILNQCDQILD